MIQIPIEFYSEQEKINLLLDGLIFPIYFIWLTVLTFIAARCSRYYQTKSSLSIREKTYLLTAYPAVCFVPFVTLQMKMPETVISIHK